MNNYKIITNQKNWMESTAINQLKKVAEYKGVVSAVGLPDLHAGRSPVGISVITKEYIYPYLIGGDIGCGMGLFDTKVPLKKFKIKKWQTRLNSIKTLSDLPTKNPYEDKSPIWDLGTIGGGNHFAEFQQIEKIYNPSEFEKINRKENILLFIHSGSRAYGQQILNKFSVETGYRSDSDEAAHYFTLHDHATKWAKRNRQIVSDKLIDYLGYSKKSDCLIDCKHNYLEKVDDYYIHRKGATSSTDGLIVIPGSRGSFTYIVKPIGDKETSAFSLSHGSGRKWARSVCKGKIKNKYNRDSIRQTDLKSLVVCHDTELLYQEAPEVYKNVDDIIQVLLEHKLIEIVATLRPLITFKG